MRNFILGLDLGQLNDYTALAVAEQKITSQGEKRYDVRWLERFPLRTPYPVVVQQAQERIDRIGRDFRDANVRLAVDDTGVGRAVSDLFERDLASATLHPITITSGGEVSREGRRFSVPKRDLVGTLQVLFQTDRLQIAEALPHAKTLVNELLAFEVKIKPQTAHDTYSAREGAHDDLVLAVALAAWLGEHTSASTASYLVARARGW